MYGYDYYPNNSITTNVNLVDNMAIWIIVSLVLAIIGGVTAYFLFVKSNKKIENKKLEWLKNFLNFKKMLIEDLLKISYLILAIFITLYSFALIAVNFFAFILVLTLGNLMLRLVYEASLVLIMIWKNTNEINKKLKK